MAQNRNKGPYRYRPDQFKHMAEFGTIESYENPYTGIEVSEFVPQFKLHYANINTTLSMKYQTIDTQFEGTMNIAIRHNKKVEDSMLVKIDAKEYKIMDLSPSDDGYISYDILNIKRTTKGR